ncbi:hypothetical protein [Mycolicibacterium sp. J2]|uniref:hypothetical protein n=1 Tax=Mycolicibacterium sp. J2 TaxID=2993511 RepID=UPI00224B1261|nr:hypothetical protein [Mycolicibacterium sp. J2]MCX2714944.1 hypothetical protein [Mycolicibacterium sp. J2]
MYRQLAVEGPVAAVLRARAVAELLAVVAEPPGEPVVVPRALPPVEPVVRGPVGQEALAVPVALVVRVQEALAVPVALVVRRALVVQVAQAALVVQAARRVPVVPGALVVPEVVPVVPGALVALVAQEALVVRVPHPSPARCRPALRPQGPVLRCCWTPGRSAH